MIQKLVVATIFICLCIVSCNSNESTSFKKLGYDFSKANVTIFLPDTLHEISGLTVVDSTTFACIQDENGVLFLFDLFQKQLVKHYTFHINGDYEGITKVRDDMYILRSDGILFEISSFKSPHFKVKSYVTGIPANNNEGLCYDLENNRLLIACKGKIGKGPQFKDRRVIYGFDLKTKLLSSEPVYDFDVNKVKEFAENNKIDIPFKVKKKKGMSVSEPFIKFRTSAICIHPETKRLFLLSASDYLLLVYHANGTLEYIEKLDCQIFNKAEGITFMENGDLLISNEGQENRPTVLRFNYKEQ